MYFLFMATPTGGATTASKAEQLYRKYHKLMYHYAYQIVHNKDWAEDAVMEASMRMIRDIHKFDEVESSRSCNLIITMTKRSAHNVNRANRRHNQPYLSDDAFEHLVDDFDIQDVVEDREMLDIVKEELAQLPDIYRETIELKYTYDYDNQEIAEMMDVTANNVGVRANRAKEMLITQLKRRGCIPWNSKS